MEKFYVAETDWEGMKKEVKGAEKNRLVVVLLYAANREASQHMVELTRKRAQQGDFNLVRVDGLKNLERLRELSVDRDPTLIFYKNGAELSRMVGPTVERILDERINALS